MLINTAECPSGSVVIAVSGGSDSLALLHLLHEQRPEIKFFAATVDHGLRSEAATEAQSVAYICAALNIPHSTLTWTPSDKRSSQAARMARYDLLANHADEVGAATIALGHTLDDLAETLLMRSIRAKPTSGTRGLSGMTMWSSYENKKLWRPLLDTRRDDLQTYLRSKTMSWIDDPSNNNLNSERVRVRQILNKNIEGVPSAISIAKLAKLAAKSRRWLGHQTARSIDQYCSVKDDQQLVFQCPENLPRAIVNDTLSTLILAMGGMPFRTSLSKIQDLAEALEGGAKLRRTVGRCVVNIANRTATIEREARNQPPFPIKISESEIYDGRWKLSAKSAENTISAKPFITSLERFRTDVDDDVYFAIQKLLSQTKLQVEYST